MIVVIDVFNESTVNSKNSGWNRNTVEFLEMIIENLKDSKCQKANKRCEYKQYS